MDLKAFRIKFIYMKKIIVLVILSIFIISCQRNLIISGINLNRNINNKKNGIWFSLNDTSKILIFQVFHNDSLNGPYYEYNLNGTLKTKGFYKKGKKHRIWKFYDPFGSCCFLIRYNKDVVTKSIHYNTGW